MTEADDHFPTVNKFYMPFVPLEPYQLQKMFESKMQRNEYVNGLHKKIVSVQYVDASHQQYANDYEDPASDRYDPLRVIMERMDALNKPVKRMIVDPITFILREEKSDVNEMYEGSCGGMYGP